MSAAPTPALELATLSAAPKPVLHQRICTKWLGATAQAVHELVPPDVLAPVLKQLADQFINDRTRPEVMVVGMRAVRELAQRAPLLMTPDLLQVRIYHVLVTHDAANRQAVNGALARTMSHVEHVSDIRLCDPVNLQDLAGYRKYKHKEVSSAARALVSLFRQVRVQASATSCTASSCRKTVSKCCTT